MPNASGIAPGVSALAAAQLRVQALLSKLGGMALPFGPDDLARYPKRGFEAGWRLTMSFSDQVRQLDLLLPIGFPFEPPRVGLVDRPSFLTWPHVEGDGLLCLAPNTLTTDPDDPAGVVAVTLHSARALIEELVAGGYEQEFRDEFRTYWTWAADDACPLLISLARPEPPTRAVAVWRGKKSYIFGESQDQIEKWIINRFGSKPSGFRTNEAVLFWIGSALVPSEYPVSGHDVRALAAQAGAEAEMLLAQISRNGPDKIGIVLGVDTPSGPALGGVVVSAAAQPRKGGARDPLHAGFRLGHIPDPIYVSRYFNASIVRRGPVMRADAAWIHGRGHDARFPDLQRKRIVVLGAGSVGAPIALSLAQAGVGHADIVDPESLSWPNVGRHPLGADFVGDNKAKGLAQKLRRDFPHVTATPYDIDIDSMVRRHPDVLASSDLIVAATGSWGADRWLKSWREESGAAMPVLYAWTEAHACAGHAVLLGPNTGCLQCGFNSTGVPEFQITAWPEGATTRIEPACGAVYQPYGPVELGFITSLAAELAIDALLIPKLAPVHRAWVAPLRRLQQAGGEWSEVWQRDSLFRSEGAFVIQRPWPEAACGRCRKALAA